MASGEWAVASEQWAVGLPSAATRHPLLVTRYSSPAAEEGRDDIEDSNPLAAEHMKEAGIHGRSVDVTPSQPFLPIALLKYEKINR